MERSSTELRNETPPEIIVPLKCQCGNRDDTGMIAPPCSAGCGRRMVLDIKTKLDPDLRPKALAALRDALAKASVEATRENMKTIDRLTHIQCAIVDAVLKVANDSSTSQN